MSVFEEYKKNNIKNKSKKNAKTIWQKEDDGSIVLKQDLNEEMVKSFFSSARNAFVGIVAEDVKQKEIEDENNLAEEMYEIRVANEYDKNLKDSFIDLNSYFEDDISFSDDEFDAFDFNDKGEIVKGISAKRYTNDNQNVVDVWVFNNNVEEEAKFVDADYEEIMEWIKSIF